jgi:hypothetical protein
MCTRAGRVPHYRRMDADWSVELGPDAPTLAVPWTSDDGRLRFYDLRAQPELLLYIEEAARSAELGEFLAALNSTHSCVQTAKCDVWFSRELSEVEAIYGASCKFGSYIDLIFTAHEARASVAEHEQLAKRLCELLRKAPEISAAAEFIVRRCHYEISLADPPLPLPVLERQREDAEFAEGFYVTFYLFGYDDEEADARRRWSIALRLIGNAILQVSAEIAASSKEP